MLTCSATVCLIWKTKAFTEIDNCYSLVTAIALLPLVIAVVVVVVVILLGGILLSVLLLYCA